MNFWDINSLDIHQDRAQIERQSGLSSLSLVDKFNRKNTHFSVIDDENIYTTTLDDCTCPDFASRRLPCKHMYFIAKKFKKFKTTGEKRSTTLIADFSSGYAKDWFFSVRTANYLALDILNILTTEKDKITKKTHKVYKLKQGKFFNFVTCAVFYDNKLAHELVWKEALKTFKYSLQIQETIPSSKVYTFKFENDTIIRNVKFIYGTVTFNLYKTNDEHTKEELIKTFTCEQDKFITFLKTGKLDNRLDLGKDIIND